MTWARSPRLLFRGPAALGALAFMGVTGCGGPASTGVAAGVTTAPVSPPVSYGVAGTSLQEAAVRAPADGGPGPVASASAPHATGATKIGAVQPFPPQQLRLPSGRRVVVRPESTAADGQLQIPADPAVVGWWSGGSRPGDPYGTTVLAGHIDSRAYGVGALAELAVVRPGAMVTVSAGSAQVRYRITKVTRIPKAQLVPDTDAFDPTGTPRLVLITCGGKYDAATHHYADNVLVTAEPTP